MSWQVRSEANFIVSLQQKIDVLQQKGVIIAKASSFGPGFGSGGGSIGSGIGTQLGPTAHQPLVVNITDLDVLSPPVNTSIFDKIDLQATMMIVDHTSTPMDLRIIQAASGALSDGQHIFLRPKEGKQIVLKSGGLNANIDIAADVTVSDNQIAELIFLEDSTNPASTGNYIVVGVGTGGGGEVFTWSADHSANTFDLTNLDRLLFSTLAGDPLTATQTGITADTSGIIHNAITGAQHTFFINADATASLAIGLTSLIAQTIIPVQTADTLGLSGARWDNVFVVSANISTNLTSSGNSVFGTTSADDISFLGRIDTNFIADADGLRDIGSDAVRWANGFFDNLNASGTGSISVSLVTTSTSLTANGSFFALGNIDLGSDNTDNMSIQARLTTAFIPDTASIDLGGTITNGQFRHLYLQSGFNVSKIFFDGGSDTYITGSGLTGTINFFADNTVTARTEPGGIGITGGRKLRSTSATEIGIQVGNEALTVGTEGSLISPYFQSTTYPTNAGTETDFGTVDGGIGVQHDTDAGGSADARLVFRAGGVWYFLTGFKL